jgi:hypothetical protein
LTDYPTSALTGRYTSNVKIEVSGDNTSTISKPFVRLTNTNDSYGDGDNETRIEFTKTFNSYSSNVQTLGYVSVTHAGIANDMSGQMRLFVNNGSVPQEAMVIKPSGYVGLGYQVTPRGIFHVVDADNANVVVMSSSNNQLVYGERNRIYFAGKTSSTNAGSDPALFSLSAIQGCSGSANDNVAGRLDLLTNSANGDGVVQRLSILPSGNVGVSITEPQSIFQVGPTATLVTGTTGMQAGTIITLNYGFLDDNIIGGFIVFNNNGQITRRIVSRVYISGVPQNNKFNTDVSDSIGTMIPVSMYYPGLNVVSGGNVAIGVNTSSSRLHVEGAMSTAIKTVTYGDTVSGTYTVTPRDSTLLGDATSGAISMSLPTVASCAGRIYIFKKIDNSVNSVILTPSDSAAIDGSPSYSLTSQYAMVRIQNDGVDWWII